MKPMTIDEAAQQLADRLPPGWFGRIDVKFDTCANSKVLRECRLSLEAGDCTKHSFRMQEPFEDAVAAAMDFVRNHELARAEAGLPVVQECDIPF